VADILTPAQRHSVMSRVHSASTKPELKLRHTLWHLGFRYKVNDKRLPGTPDIVLPKYRTVIFVHGCFWHGHKECKYYSIPKTNIDFWVSKVSRNKERDQVVWRQLEAKGWFVIVVWECQLKRAKYKETINRVVSEIVKNGESYRISQEDRRLARESYRNERRELHKREEILMQEIRDRL
jgi:DNA mismatch endonuclease (patch repair protein)